MGHSDGSVQRRYRHQLEHQLQEDAERVEAWLQGAIEGKDVGLPQAVRKRRTSTLTRHAAADCTMAGVRIL